MKKLLRLRRFPVPSLLSRPHSRQEFARAIEGFEERLLGIENNVTKEIAAIKSIAESLSSSSSKLTSQGAAGANRPTGNGNGNSGSNVATQQDLMAMERRLTSMETGLNTILSRLDGLGQTIHNPSTNGPSTGASASSVSDKRK
jgi:hypothetical protein